MESKLSPSRSRALDSSIAHGLCLFTALATLSLLAANIPAPWFVWAVALVFTALAYGLMRKASRG